MDLRVCLADLEDADHAAAVVDVLDSYASDPIGGGTPLTAGARGRLVPMLREHPAALVLLALNGRQPVGLAICFVTISTFRARPLLNVHDLAVVPGRRGQGIGRALLQEVERQARQRGCCKLSLEVQEDNAPALGLYRSFGFVDLVFGDSAPTRYLVKAI